MVDNIAEQRAYDVEARRVADTQGFRVLRFWNHEVLTQVEGVKKRSLGGAKTPPLQFSPEAGASKIRSARD